MSSKPKVIQDRFESGWSWATPSGQNGQGDIICKDGRLGYIKTLNSEGKGSPPHPLIEQVSYKLADQLNLPIPRYFPARLATNELGLASIKVVPPMAELHLAPLEGQDLLEKFADRQIFPGILTFDVFVGNNDRHGQNLIFRELDDQPWQVYIIDHTHVCHGAEWLNGASSPDIHIQGSARSVNTFIRADNTKLLSLYKITATPESVQEWVEKIENISEETIECLVEETPAEFATDEHKSRLKTILTERKHHLKGMFESFFNDGGWNAY
jgi:hypothetical protein